MGRVSKQQAGQNRRAALEASADLIREKGVEGVGIREVMTSVGLTQGAFAKQFESKDALLAEACTLAFEGAQRVLDERAETGAYDLAAYYLAPKPLAEACPMATLAMDAARAPQDSAFRAAYEQGLGLLAETVAGKPVSPDRLVLMAAMVGASILRKASRDQTLCAEMETAILEFSRTLDQAGGTRPGSGKAVC
ncbi:TetR/AcrR family transcriptional regulator [Amorphus sp. 3PC139-8]|uniref:TetR/AcrR family transcriptional regulator n=1 Tax=Amorphus sp. 3PC139-8 TaxID=2735676 RepID=UPI00345DFB1C